MSSRKKTLVAAIFATLFALAALYLTTSGNAKLLAPDDAQTVASGKRTYEAQCASCHGADLRGEENWKQPKPDGRMPAPPHDETGHTWHHSEQQLFAITKFGLAEAAGLKDYETDMPAYKDVLTDAEIVAVLSYIKAQWPAAIRASHDEMSAPR